MRKSGYYSVLVKIAQPTRDVAVAAAFALGSGALCWAFLHRYQLGAADFTWAHSAARDLLSGKDPYAHTPPGAIPYPLTAALAALPFATLPAEIAGALFFGISSGLLALALVRQGPSRLLIFLAYPYWAALMTAQWSPLLMCAAFHPIAFAFCTVKPQVGGPVALTHLSPKGAVAGALLLIASLIWMPRWPLEWISQVGSYQHFVPLLVLPGPLLALAAWRYRDRDARLLLLCALMPQRWFYDSFVLWLIPKNRRNVMATVACSWIVGIWRWYHMPHSIHDVGLWSVLGFYFPMLLIVLLRSGNHRTATS